VPDTNGFDILISSNHPSLRELRKRHITYRAKLFELTDLLHAFEKYLA
jgi:hypothetical protein